MESEIFSHFFVAMVSGTIGFLIGSLMAVSKVDGLATRMAAAEQAIDTQAAMIERLVMGLSTILALGDGGDSAMASSIARKTLHGVRR